MLANPFIAIIKIISPTKLKIAKSPPKTVTTGLTDGKTYCTKLKREKTDPTRIMRAPIPPNVLFDSTDT